MAATPSNARHATLTIRVSHEELETLRTRAANRHEPVSQLIRRWIREGQHRDDLAAEKPS